MIARLKQRATRLVYPYGSVRRVLRGPAAGLRYEVGPGLGVSYALGRGFDLDQLARDVRPGMVVFDLGANRGAVTLPMSRWVGPSGRVIAFEPVSDICRALNRNVALNGATNVEVRCAAASDRNGSAAFLFAPTHPTCGKLADVEPTSGVGNNAWTLRVQTVTLDSVIEAGARTPDLIKIDVQGGAAAALRGARRLLDTAPPAIWIELHGPQEHEAVRDELVTRGYTLTTLDGRRIIDAVVDHEQVTTALRCEPPNWSR
jgi:FkbM family methyltransferase